MLPNFSESLRCRAWQSLAYPSLLLSSFPFHPQVHCRPFCSLGPALLSLRWVSVHLNLLLVFPCALQLDARWWLVPMFGFCVWSDFPQIPKCCSLGLAQVVLSLRLTGKGMEGSSLLHRLPWLSLSFWHTWSFQRKPLFSKSNNNITIWKLILLREFLQDSFI